MIDREHELSVTRQARVLDISRSSVYYLPRPASPGDLALMRRMDELHLDYPFAGARMLRDLLGREGFAVGRLHVSTLMKRMGIEAIYRRPEEVYLRAYDTVSDARTSIGKYLAFYNGRR